MCEGRLIDDIVDARGEDESQVLDESERGLKW